MHEDCPFCDSEGMKKVLISEKERTFVVLSSPCLMQGHLLIIPKRHVEKLSELTAEERKELFDTAVEFQEKILNGFASGRDLAQNCRPFLPENKLKIDHIHIHVRPREFEDEFYEKCLIFEKDIFKEISEKDIKTFRKIFADNNENRKSDKAI